MRKHLLNILTALIILIVLAAVSLSLYPTVSEWWNARHQSYAIANYTEAVDNLDAELYARLWNDAVAYNEKLYKQKAGLTSLTEEEWAEYESQLDVSGTGIMGYIEIPGISGNLPIYHGTDEGILQIAVGHIEGSSLPVGGENTHCVLSGHRGLPSAKLFTNLDEMVVGDVFMLHTLGETLTYEVDQIVTVLPEEVDELGIIDGEDLCTLVTCTPYGINTHRLLVRGHRIENIEVETEEIEEPTPEETKIDEKILYAAVAVGFVAGALVTTIISALHRRHKKKKRLKRSKKIKQRAEEKAREIVYKKK